MKIKKVIFLAEKELPKSYRYLVDEKIFLDDAGNNLAPGIFERRFENHFVDIQTLLKKYDLIKYCTVNEELLWRAVLDYFADIARLKNFHNQPRVQTDKIFSYEMFWLLRNHPIQIVKPDEIDRKYMHVNEYIFSVLFILKLAIKLNLKFASNIQIDDLIKKFEDHELSKDFRKKLYYTFKFRIYTPKSLLLLVEGFMTAAEFVLQVT
jgi:hypothetical protein